MANQPGVRTVIVLEGINDIGFSLVNFGSCNLPNPHETARQSIDGQRVLIAEAHARGIKIIEATVLPIKGSFYDAGDSEAVRDALNEWIRTSGEYDVVADLDRASADPADPDKRSQARPPYGCPARSSEFPFTTAPRSPCRRSTASASPTRRC